MEVIWRWPEIRHVQTVSSLTHYLLACCCSDLPPVYCPNRVSDDLDSRLVARHCFPARALLWLCHDSFLHHKQHVITFVIVQLWTRFRFSVSCHCHVSSCCNFSSRPKTFALFQFHPSATSLHLIVAVSAIASRPPSFVFLCLLDHSCVQWLISCFSIVDCRVTSQHAGSSSSFLCAV